MAKISILFLYIRVLTYDYARRAAYAVLAIVVIYNILGFISTMTLCRPLRAYWDLSIHEKKCHPPSLMWVAIGLHIGTDFLIFLIPMPVILRMSLPWGQKIGLFVVFALGFLYDHLFPLRTLRRKLLLTRFDSPQRLPYFNPTSYLDPRAHRLPGLILRFYRHKKLDLR